MSTIQADTLNPPRGPAGLPSGWPHVILVTLVLAGFNAIKPPVVDDVYYLKFAEAVAAHPLDPYGMMIAWEHWPVPGNQGTCPPVFSYWLALWIHQFGIGWVGLKLWMTPWCLLWAASMFGLLKRWSAAVAVPLLWLTAVSPLWLPAVNLMIDLPMNALVLASVWVFAIACDRGSQMTAMGAGVLAALAVQTKYHGVTGIGAIGLYALLFGHIRLGALAIGVCLALVGAWESRMASLYGESHMWMVIHLHDSFYGDGMFSPGNRWRIPTGIGATCPVFALAAWWASGIARRYLFVGEIMVVGLFVGVLGFGLWPHLLYGAAGALVILAMIGAAVFAVRGGKWRITVELFLAGWLLSEVAVTMAISPFPAIRRFVGMTSVLVLIIGRLYSSAAMTGPREGLDSTAGPVPGGQGALWRLAALSGVLGLVYQVSDMAHGYAIQRAMVQAVGVVERQPAPPPATSLPAGISLVGGPAKMWTNLLWSGAYFAQTMNIRQIDLDLTTIPQGDFLITRKTGITAADVVLSHDRMDLVETISVDDAWPWTTIPDYYGGGLPLVRRTGPWVVLEVIRCKQNALMISTNEPAKVAHWALARGAPLPPGSIRALMDVIFMADPTLRDAMVDVLRKNGPDLLVPGLQLPDPRARLLSLMLLASDEADSERLIPIVRDVADRDPDPRVRTSAAEVVRRLRKVNQ